MGKRLSPRSRQGLVPAYGVVSELESAVDEWEGFS